MTTMAQEETPDKVYVISVDSRGKATSDMSCYMEHVCKSDFFRDHIMGNPKTICVKSQAASLCGLDLDVYFHLHSPYHHVSKDDYHIHKPMCTNVNGIATLLTFNTETGYYNHLIFGKAYVLLDEGTTPLSMQQLWGLVEFITESKNLYHQDNRLVSEEAYTELRDWAARYRAQTWAPRSIYEPRHPKKPIYFRFASGLSDQATCHHGEIHVHHDGHHECCHNEEDDIWESSSKTDHLLMSEISCVPNQENEDHHVVVDPSPHSDHHRPRSHTPAHHDRHMSPPCIVPHSQ